MANPYSGLISSAFKQAYNNAIDALIEGCETPCKFFYVPVIYTQCTACKVSPASLRGPNPLNGGSLGKHTGTCPLCKGDSKIPAENSETLSLIVIFDYKKFLKPDPSVNYKDGQVMTVCNINLSQKIKNATHVYFNTDIQNISQHKFIRDGEPLPCGLGDSRYVITLWRSE